MLSISVWEVLRACGRDRETSRDTTDEVRAPLLQRARRKTSRDTTLLSSPSSYTKYMTAHAPMRGSTLKAANSWRSVSLRIFVVEELQQLKETVASLQSAFSLVPLLAMLSSPDSGSPSSAESLCSSAESSVHVDELSIYSSMAVALGVCDSGEDSPNTTSSPDPVSMPPVRAAVSPVKDEPPYSCVALIAMAIEDTPDRRQTLSGICDYFTGSFYYYSCLESNFLRKSIRYNLSVHPCFKKLPSDNGSGDEDSQYWALNLHLQRALPEKATYRPQVQHSVYSPAAWTGGCTHTEVGSSSQYCPYPYPSTSTTRSLHVFSAPPSRNTNHNNNTRTSLPPLLATHIPSRSKRGSYSTSKVSHSADPERSLDLSPVPCYFTQLGNSTIGWSNGLISEY